MTRNRTRSAALGVTVALAFAACGDSDPTASAPSTSASTTVAPTTAPATSCPAVGSTSEQTGSSTVTRSPAVALLRHVQVQASACVDEVAFLFMGGLPGWRVAYHDGPVVEDPSGRSVQVGGDAHLLVRFEPAAGVDLAGAAPIVTYEGPPVVRPAAPSGVQEVRRIGDFEAVNTWVVGLPNRRDFEVAARDGQLVLRVEAPTPRDTRCGLAPGAVTVGYPPDWFADLGGDRPCRYFAPEPFPVHPGTDAADWAVTVDQADTSRAAVVGRLRSGRADVSITEVEVAGASATRVDVVERGDGMLPSGFAYRMYVLDAGGQAVTVTGSPALEGARLDANREAVDRIVPLVRTTSGAGT